MRLNCRLCFVLFLLQFLFYQLVVVTSANICIIAATFVLVVRLVVAVVDHVEHGRVRARLLAVSTEHVSRPIACLQFGTEVQATCARFVQRFAEHAHEVSRAIGRVRIIAELFGTFEDFVRGRW